MIGALKKKKRVMKREANLVWGVGLGRPLWRRDIWKGYMKNEQEWGKKWTHYQAKETGTKALSWKLVKKAAGSWRGRAQPDTLASSFFKAGVLHSSALDSVSPSYIIRQAMLFLFCFVVPLKLCALAF